MTANTKLSSLKWAIEELTKQKEDLAAKLKIVQKRDETNSLIQEVFAQKDALEKRISALQDGLKVSADLVDLPPSDLETELGLVNEKLEIAQERLDNIEQEEYLEELGKKLNRSTNFQEDLTSTDSPLINDTALDLSSDQVSAQDTSISSPDPSNTTTSPSLNEDSLPSQLSQMMKTHSNRIPEIKIEENQKIDQLVDQVNPDSSQVSFSLEETAASLGVDPDFLSEKGLQAILRMISRNKGKLTFPLEVEQIG